MLFWEDPESAVPRLTEKIQESYDKIAVKNATPIFCTIPPAHLETWNTKRKEQRKTHILKHTEKYPTMQQHLQDSLIKINKFINNMNMTNNSYTPKLADTVIRKKGRGKGYRLYFENLSDGVHATNNTTEKWAEIIVKAIMRNRYTIAGPSTRLVTVRSRSDSESDPEHPTKRAKFTTERKF